MKKFLVASLAVLLLVPQLAHSEVYKCKRTGGSVSFQDRPCAVGETSSTLAVPTASADAAAAPAQPRASGAGPRPMAPALRGPVQVDEKVRENNEKVMAYNKMQLCNAARKELGTLKEQAPVYRRDNAGNRKYVEDSDRPAAIAAAERKVTAECR